MFLSLSPTRCINEHWLAQHLEPLENPSHAFSRKLFQLLSGALEVKIKSKFMGSFIPNKKMKLNMHQCHFISVRNAFVSLELLPNRGLSLLW